MDIQKQWPKIREHFSKSFGSSLHVSIASVNADGDPQCTPIGSLFLNDDQSGFYFEKYPSTLPKFAKESPRICVLGVNSSKSFWLRSLYKDKFSAFPAVKLYGQLGEKRKATESELNALRKRMRKTSILKGHKTLWGKMESVREVRFSKAERVKFGKMTRLE
ncbi:MAG: pyridoxamine 5'-phosphate oxidase family protein [Saprospiraceae bacterium]|nr:pyridoxamine 5'-phosphate oxidase family protein [Saprospiraceae bacterium]